MLNLGGALVGGGVGGLLGLGGKMLGLGETDWEDQYKEALRLMTQLRTPEFADRDIAPAQLASRGDYQAQEYDPRIAGDTSLVEGSPDMRAQQVQNLAHLGEYTGRDLPLSERLAAQEAQRMMSSQSQGLTQSALEAMAMRGNLGGGQEATLRAGANQSAMEMGRGMGADLTQHAIQARRQALGMSSDMAGQVRGQDMAEQGFNADALNRFN